MSGVRIEAAKEGEACVGAIPVVGIADEKIDHGAVLLGPGGVELRDRRGGHDEVAVVKVVIVHFGSEAVGAVVSQERGPGAVVVENTTVARAARAHVELDPVDACEFARVGRVARDVEVVHAVVGDECVEAGALNTEIDGGPAIDPSGAADSAIGEHGAGQ